jgi:hypothetical protein
MRMTVLVVAAAAVLGVLGLGGCKGTRSAMVPVEGLELSRDYGPTVEVNNFRGTVQVIADPHRAPGVSAKVRPVGKNAPTKGKELVKSYAITATNGVEGGRRLLRVVTTPALDAEGRPLDVAVDLVVRVPKTEGVRVFNRGGDVDLVGVAGPVTVENGIGGTIEHAGGGDVYLRTGAAMTEPVTITSTGGNVTYQVGPGSTGRFDITSDKGPAEFYSRLGNVTEVRPTMGRYTAVLDDGANRVALHTNEGTARAMVLPNSATYGPDTWNGWPTWPKTPRPIGRLGGYYNDEPMFKNSKPGAPTP